MWNPLERWWLLKYFYENGSCEVINRWRIILGKKSKNHFWEVKNEKADKK